MINNRAALADIPEKTLEAFRDYHRSRPWIFDAFYSFAREIKSTGRTRYGAKSIMERVRWEFEKDNPGEDFKVANSFVAYYARLVECHDPSFEGFFEKRQLKGLGGI